MTWHLTVGWGGRPACERGIGFPFVQCEYEYEGQAREAASKHGLVAVEGPCPAMEEAAPTMEYTVEAYWHTTRQAAINICARSPEEALRLAKRREDEWIGTNRELDNSDGPTSWAVHAGFDNLAAGGEGTLYEHPADRRQDHADRLRDALLELLNCPDLNLDELEPVTLAAIAYAGAVLKLTHQGPRTRGKQAELLAKVEAAHQALTAACEAHEQGEG